MTEVKQIRFEGSKIYDVFRKYNDYYGIEYNNQKKKSLMGYIVFKNGKHFKQEYPLEGRTYIVFSNDKAFFPNLCGYSIYGCCLDGSDDGVRLDYYRNWPVEYSYLEYTQENMKMLKEIGVITVEEKSK